MPKLALPIANDESCPSSFRITGSILTLSSPKADYMLQSSGSGGLAKSRADNKMPLKQKLNATSKGLAIALPLEVSSGKINAINPSTARNN